MPLQFASETESPCSPPVDKSARKSSKATSNSHDFSPTGGVYSPEMANSRFKPQIQSNSPCWNVSSSSPKNRIKLLASFVQHADSNRVANAGLSSTSGGTSSPIVIFHTDVSISFRYRNRLKLKIDQNGKIWPENQWISNRRLQRKDYSHSVDPNSSRKAVTRRFGAGSTQFPNTTKPSATSTSASFINEHKEIDRLLTELNEIEHQLCSALQKNRTSHRHATGPCKKTSHYDAHQGESIQISSPNQTSSVSVSAAFPSQKITITLSPEKRSRYPYWQQRKAKLCQDLQETKDNLKFLKRSQSLEKDLDHPDDVCKQTGNSIDRKFNSQSNLNDHPNCSDGANDISTKSDKYQAFNSPQMSPSGRSVNVTEEIETISLKPIGRGVRDLSRSRTITTTFRKEPYSKSITNNALSHISSASQANTLMHNSPIYAEVSNDKYQMRPRNHPLGSSTLHVVHNHPIQSGTLYRSSTHLRSRSSGRPFYNLKIVQDCISQWYWPKATRTEIAAYLSKQEPGNFIIRDSSSFTNCYGLALRVSANLLSTAPNLKRDSAQSNDDLGSVIDLIRHFLIEKLFTDEGNRGFKLKGFIKEPVFPSLASFVLRHTQNRIGLPLCLLLPKSNVATTSTHKEYTLMDDERATPTPSNTNASAANPSFSPATSKAIEATTARAAANTKFSSQYSNQTTKDGFAEQQIHAEKTVSNYATSGVYTSARTAARDSATGKAGEVNMNNTNLSSKSSYTGVIDGGIDHQVDVNNYNSRMNAGSSSKNSGNLTVLGPLSTGSKISASNLTTLQAMEAYFLGKIHIDRLRGNEAVRVAINKMILPTDKTGLVRVNKCVQVRIVVSLTENAIIIIDKFHNSFVRKKLSANNLLWIGFDPLLRIYTAPKLLDKNITNTKLFGIVVKKSRLLIHENCVYIFSELDPSLPSQSLFDYAQKSFNL